MIILVSYFVRLQIQSHSYRTTQFVGRNLYCFASYGDKLNLIWLIYLSSVVWSKGTVQLTLGNLLCNFYCNFFCDSGSRKITLCNEAWNEHVSPSVAWRTCSIKFYFLQWLRQCCYSFCALPWGVTLKQHFMQLVSQRCKIAGLKLHKTLPSVTVPYMYVNFYQLQFQIKILFAIQIGKSSV